MVQPAGSVKDLTFDSGQPVRGFIGQVVDITEGTASEFSRPIHFKCLHVEVYKSLIPWKFPQFDLIIPYSAQGQRWTLVAGSVKEIKGSGFRLGNLSDDKMWIRAEYTEGHATRERVEVEGKVEWKDTTMEAWEFLAIGDTRDEVAKGIAELDGVTPPTAPTEASSSEPEPELDDVLLELADGKDDNDFQQAAMTDTRIQNTGVFNNLMTNGVAVLADLQGAGKISKGEDGLWHKA